MSTEYTALVEDHIAHTIARMRAPAFMLHMLEEMPESITTRMLAEVLAGLDTRIQNLESEHQQ